MTELADNLMQGFSDSYLYSFKYLEELLSLPIRDYKLSFEQFTILSRIAESAQRNESELSITQIADERGVTKGAIWRHIQQLTKIGYVKQTVSTNDHRLMVLSLTEKGKEIQSLALEAERSRFADWVKIYGEKEAGDFLKLFQRFNEKIAFVELNHRRPQKEKPVRYRDIKDDL